jgi:hypothetical protein
MRARARNYPKEKFSTTQEIKLYMDHVDKAIPVVDQADVFSDDDITVMSRTPGQGD